MHPGTFVPTPQALREHLHAPLGVAAFYVSLGLGFVALAASLVWGVATDPVLMGIPPDSAVAPFVAVAFALAIVALGMFILWSAWASVMDDRSGVVLVQDVEALRTSGPVRGGQFLSYRDASGKERSVKLPGDWQLGELPRRARLVTSSHSGMALELELEGLRFSVLSGAGRHAG